MLKFLKTKGLKKQKKLKKTKKIKKVLAGNNNYLRKVLNNIKSRFSKKSKPITKPITKLITEPIMVNKINGNSIYRITIKGCNYYFFGNNKKYVLVPIRDKNYIYKLDNDIEELPKDIDAINMAQKINFEEKKEEIVDWQEWQDLIDILAKNNILYFDPDEFSPDKCPTANLNLDKAKTKLIELNAFLQQKCSNLSLYLDYVYNHKTDSTLELYEGLSEEYSDGPYLLVLCLYNDNHCISSITITIDGIELGIDSRTHTDYERRKYNILLRSIIIIIAKYLSSDITYIKSTAINPTSAYILMQHFGGTLFKDDGINLGYYNRKFFNFSKTNGMPLYQPDTNYKKIFELYKKQGLFEFLVIAVELNDENIKNAYNKFHDLLTGISQITC
jgi:hypothetical protein